MGRLDGQIAVVTGASTGIGRAIALAFAAEGADVVVNYRQSADLARNVVAQITDAGRRAIALAADVSRKSDVERLVAETLRAFGTVHAWVNNAGCDILTGEAAAWPRRRNGTASWPSISRAPGCARERPPRSWPVGVRAPSSTCRGTTCCRGWAIPRRRSTPPPRAASWP